MNPNTSTIEMAEELLAAAGIATTRVADCDEAGCPWCVTDPLPLAA